jgi:hypothetical protein
LFISKKIVNGRLYFSLEERYRDADSGKVKSKSKSLGTEDIAVERLVQFRKNNVTSQEDHEKFLNYIMSNVKRGDVKTLDSTTHLEPTFGSKVGRILDNLIPEFHDVMDSGDLDFMRIVSKLPTQTQTKLLKMLRSNYVYKALTPYVDEIIKVAESYNKETVDLVIEGVSHAILCGENFKFQSYALYHLINKYLSRIIEHVGVEEEDFFKFINYSNEQLLKEIMISSSKEQSKQQKQTNKGSVKSVSHYKVLGLEEGATSQEVKTAYRNLMKTVHPDKGGNQFLFELVKEAYEQLSE